MSQEGMPTIVEAPTGGYDAEHLLVEYQANVDLWKHDDMLRQERDKKFLTINTILIVTLGVFLRLGSASTVQQLSHSWGLSLAVILLAGAGLGSSVVWHYVLARNAEYVRLRRMLLRALEKELRSLGTFQYTHRALDNEEDLYFSTLDEVFVVEKRRGKISSTATEGRLPLCAGIFWAGMLAVGAGFLLRIMLTGSSA